MGKTAATFIGNELAAEYGITRGQQNEGATDSQQSRQGECPYCHRFP